MLLPDSRTVAFELIRPPSGYRLDFAVLTTYTLDEEGQPQVDAAHSHRQVREGLFGRADN